MFHTLSDITVTHLHRSNKKRKLKFVELGYFLPVLNSFEQMKVRHKLLLVCFSLTMGYYSSSECLKCTNESSDKNSSCFDVSIFENTVNTPTCHSLFACTKK